jgi:hypothetical protein
MNAYLKKTGCRKSGHSMAAVFLAALLSALPLRPANAQLVLPCDPCTTLVIGELTATAASMATIATETTLIANAVWGTAPVGIDYDVQNGFAQTNSILELLGTQILPGHAQMNADKTKTYNDIQGQVNEGVHSVTSEISTHCAITELGQIQNALEGFTSSMTDGLVRLISNRDTGPGSGQASVAQEACERAPFISNNPFGGGNAYSPRFTQAVANLLANCPQSDANGAGTPLPAYLIDGDLDETRVFKPLQFQLPDKVKLTANNHIQFTPQNDSEWEFVAAWRFCESNIAKQASVMPADTTATSVNAVELMVDIDTKIADSAPAIRDCVQAIADRTACPQDSSSDFISVVPNTCWQIQNLACHRLTNSPPSGLGITATGNPDVDYALANCDDDGLSYAMTIYALARKCGDPNYMMVAVPGEKADATQASLEVNSCASVEKELHRIMVGQKESFTNSLLAMRKTASK